MNPLLESERDKSGRRNRPPPTKFRRIEAADIRSSYGCERHRLAAIFETRAIPDPSFWLILQAESRTNRTTPLLFVVSDVERERGLQRYASLANPLQRSVT